AFHDGRLAALAAGTPPDIAIDLTAEAATEAIAAGRPLLGEGELTCEVDDVAAEVKRLARNLGETSVEGSPAQRTAERLATEDLDVGPLLEDALNGDADAIARAANEHGYDPAAFAQLVELALQPVLWEAAAKCATLTEIDKWDRGYCPVCGSWPALAELVGSEKRRVLRCGRCGTWWSWLVLLCPYCGNDDHRSLGTLRSEDSRDRVDVCEHCHGYVKAVATFTLSALSERSLSTRSESFSRACLPLSGVISNAIAAPAIAPARMPMVNAENRLVVSWPPPAWRACLRPSFTSSSIRCIARSRRSSRRSSSLRSLMAFMSSSGRRTTSVRPHYRCHA